MNGAVPEKHEPAIEESAEELYEMAPCGYLTTAIDTRIIKVNRTLTEWLGYDHNEMTGGKRFVDLLTAGGRIFYETHFNLLLRMQSSVDEIAVDMICKDGRVLPVLVNARQKRSADGEPVLNRFTIFNASERRMYERELVTARDLLRTTLASIGDGVVTTDGEGRITFMNPVAAAICGWKEEAALGMPIEQVLILVREDTDERIENWVTQTLRTGTSMGEKSHTVLIAQSGTRFSVDDSASLIRDADGDILGAVLVFRDISERRRTEQELADSHRKLEVLAAELRRSNEDLSQFAYVASHDLRSPLKTVLQFAQLLERRYSEQLGDGKQLLDYITASAKGMATLIEDLLGYATVSVNAADAQTEINVQEQLETAMANLEATIAQSGASVTYDALPSLRVNGTNLIQIFQNLIGNAIHYRRDARPQIHISAQELTGEWLFSCKDNGIGVAPEYQSQIFEPFKRLHGADRPGSGIGLAVCKKIVERYQGRIWLESQPDEGSTFFFTFPKSI